MNTFFDTNVIIGYIYSLDYLNTASKKVMLKKNNKYYSFHVKKEVNTVTHRKDREYSKFLLKLDDILNKYNDNDLIDLSEIHKKINRFGDIGKLEVYNMHSAIDIIWQDLQFNENTDAFIVKSKFSEYFNNFQSKHRICKKYCLNKMTCIPAYQNKDSNVLKVIEKKSLRDYFHGEDEDILFDVHDYLKNNSITNLVLISNDRDFIKSISELIDVLAFDKFMYLEDLLKNS